MIERIQRKVTSWRAQVDAGAVYDSVLILSLIEAEELLSEIPDSGFHGCGICGSVREDSQLRGDIYTDEGSPMLICAECAAP